MPSKSRMDDAIFRDSVPILQRSCLHVVLGGLSDDCTVEHGSPVTTRYDAVSGDRMTPGAEENLQSLAIAGGIATFRYSEDETAGRHRRPAGRDGLAGRNRVP